MTRRRAIDRAKRFYGDVGWRLDVDFRVGEAFRVVQFTPPGSPSSIHFGKGLTPAAPGSAQKLYLVVSDIEAARAELIGRGFKVSEVFHVAAPGQPPISGRDPEGRSYVSFASFSDPDGNSWLLQEITVRFPGAWMLKRHSPRRLTSQVRSAVRRPRTASTRSGPACGYKLGGLVRRVPGGGASRQGAAAMTPLPTPAQSMER
jgi:predicted enzyme related to lactoylglutathione lyase